MYYFFEIGIRFFILSSLVAPAVAAVRPVTKEEARLVSKICGRNQIVQVVKDHVYRLPETPAGDRFLVPSRNTWMVPPTLELQVVDRSKVAVGLDAPLWRLEKALSFQNLRRVHFEDIDKNGVMDFALDIEAKGASGSKVRLFSLYFGDAKGGFRLSDTLPSDPIGFPTLGDFISISVDQLRERASLGAWNHAVRP